MELAGFDWDGGNREKCLAHGVSLAEIEALFVTVDAHVAPDPVHSATEQRFRAVGSNGAGRMIFVVFTLREWQGQALVRPISARYMHQKEISTYEKAISRLQR